MHKSKLFAKIVGVVWMASVAVAASAPSALAQAPAPRAPSPTAPATRPVSLPIGGTFRFAENPLVRDAYTADPTVLVHNGRLYLYTGHDTPPDGAPDFVMNDWRCYSTDDMVTWRFEGTPLRTSDFAWAHGAAFASSVVERDGKFYWYTSVWPKDGLGIAPGFAMGVAVSDSPTGPFRDALGRPLLTNASTPTPKPHLHDDIDPAVFIDRDGSAHLIWGNTFCYRAKLKPSMTELDGPIEKIEVPWFTEAPFVHRFGDKLYLTYAYQYPEKIAYATADTITGPWTFRGEINDLMPACRTNHQAIIEFQGKWWFFYHSAGLSGWELRRSVCVEELHYNPDGTIRPITRTGQLFPATRPTEHTR